MSGGFGAFDFSAIKSSITAPSDPLPIPAVDAAANILGPIAAFAAAAPPAFGSPSTFAAAVGNAAAAFAQTSDSAAAFSFATAAGAATITTDSASSNKHLFTGAAPRRSHGPAPVKAKPKRSPADAEAKSFLASVSTIELLIEMSDVMSLVRHLRATSVDDLRSLPTEFPAAMKLFFLELKYPYYTPARMTREVMTKLREWQKQASSAVSDDAASASSASSSSSAAPASDFHAWLSEYNERVLYRLAAACHLAGLNGPNVSLDGIPPLIECISRFQWIDFAEHSMQSEASLLSAIQRHYGGNELVSAAAKRIEQLAALEHQRRPAAADALIDPAASISSDPMSTRSLLSVLIRDTTPTPRHTSYGEGGVSVPVLRALLTAATAPALLGSGSVFRCLSLSFEPLCQLHPDRLLEVGAVLHEFGVHEDRDRRSLTGWLIERINLRTLQRWLAPSNAHIAMPLGWIAERNDMHQGWSQALVRHAIDWHYATVTPRLREALLPHLIPDLHAEVMSFLMPPSSLPDPPLPAVPSAALVAVRSWLASLSPEQTDDADRLRSLEHTLCTEQINAGFAQRAFEAERKQWASETYSSGRAFFPHSS